MHLRDLVGFRLATLRLLNLGELQDVLASPLLVAADLTAVFVKVDPAD